MSECPFPVKRTFRTRELARVGMKTIQWAVEGQGSAYDTLYPYRCPNGRHWHLSHYRQGRVLCPVCQLKAPAWFGGKVWVISAHTAGLWPERCPGEGQHA